MFIVADDFLRYMNFTVLFWSSPDGRTDKQSENDAYEPTAQVAQVGLENCPVGPWLDEMPYCLLNVDK